METGPKKISTEEIDGDQGRGVGMGNGERVAPPAGLGRRTQEDALDDEEDLIDDDRSPGDLDEFTDDVDSSPGDRRRDPLRRTI